MPTNYGAPIEQVIEQPRQNLYTGWVGSPNGGGYAVDEMGEIIKLPQKPDESMFRPKPAGAPQGNFVQRPEGGYNTFRTEGQRGSYRQEYPNEFPRSLDPIDTMAEVDYENGKMEATYQLERTQSDLLRSGQIQTPFGQTVLERNKFEYNQKLGELDLKKKKFDAMSDIIKRNRTLSPEQQVQMKKQVYGENKIYTPPSPEGGFTLGEGQTRFDVQGRPIASVLKEAKNREKDPFTEGRIQQTLGELESGGASDIFGTTIEFPDRKAAEDHLLRKLGRNWKIFAPEAEEILNRKWPQEGSKIITKRPVEVSKVKSPFPEYPDAYQENGTWYVMKDGNRYRIE